MTATTEAIDTKARMLDDIAFRYNTFCNVADRVVTSAGMAEWVEGIFIENGGPDQYLPDALTPKEKAWARAEWDLLTCTPKVGDMIEIRIADYHGTSEPVGARCEVVGVDGDMVLTNQSRGDTSLHWGFSIQSNVREHGFRVIPSVTAPARPDWLSDTSYEQVCDYVRGAVREWSKDCTCESCSLLIGGVDPASEFFMRQVGTAISSEGRKAWIGQVLRWGRALIILNRQRQTTPPQPEPEVEPIPERNLTPPEPTIEDLKSELAAVTAQKERLERLHSTLSAFQSNALNDAATIGNKLLREANNRGWCSEYDEIISSLNSELTVLELPVRKKHISGYVRGTITIPFSMYLENIEVSPDDEEDSALSETFDENYSGSDLINYHRESLDLYSVEMEIDEIEVN